MSYLKEENLNKCVTLLREFITEAHALESQKGTAVLALNQLRKITAGTVPVLDDIRSCNGVPRANGVPES